MIRNVPLHLRCRRFHGLRVVELNAVYQDAKKELVQSLWQVAHTAKAEELGGLIAAICGQYEELRRCEQESLELERKVRDGKQRYKEVSDTHPPLSLETWERYASEPAPSLADYVLGEALGEGPGEPAAPVVTPQDRLLRALPHVWQDPQCMLPDDQGTEDLQIEGGRIELVCPITCRPFQQPMASKKCGHVFDKEGITNYFEGQAPRDCPQSACGQKLVLRDFVPDELMALRCLIQDKRIREVDDEMHLDIL